MVPHLTPQVINQQPHFLNIILLLQVQSQAITRLWNNHYTQQNFPVVAYFYPWMFPSLRKVVLQTHLHVSCHMMYQHTVQESGHYHYLDLNKIILWSHLQDSFHIISPKNWQASGYIYIHKQNNRIILSQFIQ